MINTIWQPVESIWKSLICMLEAVLLGEKSYNANTLAIFTLSLLTFFKKITCKWL